MGRAAPAAVRARSVAAVQGWGAAAGRGGSGGAGASGGAASGGGQGGAGAGAGGAQAEAQGQAAAQPAPRAAPEAPRRLAGQVAPVAVRAAAVAAALARSMDRRLPVASRCASTGSTSRAGGPRCWWRRRARVCCSTRAGRAAATADGSLRCSRPRWALASWTTSWPATTTSITSAGSARWPGRSPLPTSWTTAPAWKAVRTACIEGRSAVPAGARCRSDRS